MVAEGEAIATVGAAARFPGGAARVAGRMPKIMRVSFMMNEGRQDL